MCIRDRVYTIQAVIEDIPLNTSLSFLEKLDMLTLNDSEGTLQFNGRNNMTGGFGFALLHPAYEYADFIRQFTDSLTGPKEAYPDGITVLSPIETWSDDFSMAIAGIPSTVNDFSAGPFMQNYYHSQYDNQDDVLDLLDLIERGFDDIEHRIANMDLSLIHIYRTHIR